MVRGVDPQRLDPAAANAIDDQVKRENPAVAARDYLEGDKEKVTPEALRVQTLDLVLSQGDLLGADPLSRKIGYISAQDIAVFTRFLADSGQTKGVVPAADVMTNQFVTFANDFDHKAIVALAKAAH